MKKIGGATRQKRERKEEESDRKSLHVDFSILCVWELHKENVPLLPLPLLSLHPPLILKLVCDVSLMHTVQ